jgi:CoA:oxalate CoA-transferase
MAERGPLAGVLVVDLTRVLAGPYATMVLADLGARVIKVEQPGKGDDSRAYPPFLGGRSAYFASLNRSKESIALDLKDAADRAVLERLLARADVLVENYRAGALDRLGYGFEELHARFPHLVVARCSGFGQTGPYRDKPAYDMVVQAMGGIMSLTGHPGGPPTRVGTSVGDITAGLFTVIGILAALRERERTGRGQEVDVAMLDGQVAILENAIARYVATGQVPGPLGARHPSIAPFEAYRTADQPVVVACGNDVLFRKLAEVLGRPGWPEDPRFATNQARVEAVEALREAIEAELVQRSRAHWLGLFEREGIPSGPINDVAAVLADPQVQARRMIVEVEDPEAGPLRMAASPIRLSAHAGPQRPDPAPALDQHREAILAWLAGDAARRS